MAVKLIGTILRLEGDIEHVAMGTKKKPLIYYKNTILKKGDIGL